MRYAIFSDVHNHTAALAAVLRHAQQQGVDGYYCLGDVGIDECVELTRSVNAAAVFGNWEVTNWQRLSPKNRGWALSLPPQRKMARFWLTHAAPFWPEALTSLNDVIASRHELAFDRLFPYLHRETEDLWDSIATLTEAGIPLMFHGHTHRQLIWRFTANNQLQNSIQSRITIETGDTLIIGVGSVGQPLDGPSSYVIYDDEVQEVELVRVTGNF
ncbi:MAG: metallophosphoesterase family protein [Anaerolineaceae bacterium]|nr:metallophosphoesterase family protein [Anaerolineaceae bacterium]MCB9098845.1 metallophosphoesterase family protein [Anaerolineales bacterium]